MSWRKFAGSIHWLPGRTGCVLLGTIKPIERRGKALKAKSRALDDKWDCAYKRMKKLGPVSWLTALLGLTWWQKNWKFCDLSWLWQFASGFVTAGSQVRFRGIPCGICGGQIGWMGQVFLRVLRFSRHLSFHQCFSFVLITTHNF